MHDGGVGVGVARGEGGDGWIYGVGVGQWVDGWEFVEFYAGRRVMLEDVKGGSFVELGWII